MVRYWKKFVVRLNKYWLFGFVVCVFYLKLKEFLKDIIVKNVFGKVIVFVYIIEF